MISIRKIFEMYGVNSEGIKLVRHTNKEITILETFENNLERFEAYQSFQPSNKYGNATRIAVFSSYHKTTALFLGLWDITGFTENSNLPKNSIDVLEKHKLPQNWINELGRYMLKMNPLLQDLSRRLVIEWGAGTLAWIQSGDKEVLEIAKEARHEKVTELLGLEEEAGKDEVKEAMSEWREENHWLFPKIKQKFRFMFP